MMPRSFDEFTLAERLKKVTPRGVDWFDDRPGLLEEASAARAAGWTWVSIHNWLQSEYGYPLKSTSGLRRLLDGQL